MNNIVEYKEHYNIHLKDEEIVPIPTEAFKLIEKELASTNWFIKIGDDLYHKNQILYIKKSKVSTDVDNFILNQPKEIRKRLHEQQRKIKFNSIQHVMNYIEAISTGDI